MMNIEYKAKWLAALRSGEYKQGRKFLKKNGSYCCLGVLCDVVDPTKWNDDYDYDYGLGVKGVSAYDGVSGTLPFRIREATGFPREDNTGRWAAGVLVEMNDEGQYSFAEIANYIEEHL
jgi:hypothetical protein